MYTRAYTVADKAAFIGHYKARVRCERAPRWASGYLSTGSARYRGRQRRLNVPICPRARSPEAIHPRLPFVRPRLPQESPRRPIQTTSPYHLTAPPPVVRLETVTRKKLTDRTSLVLFLRSRPNEFIRDISRRKILACFRCVFFLFFFFLDQASRSKTLQRKPRKTVLAAHLAYNQRDTITRNWPKWIWNIYVSSHWYQSSAIELLLYSKSFTRISRIIVAWSARSTDTFDWRCDD